MTSDLSPEGSPFRPVDETTWALELIHAGEQGNLDVIRRVVPEDEEAVFLQAKGEIEVLSADELDEVLSEVFADETTLADVLEGLANTADIEQQFHIVSTLTAVQKAGLLVLSARMVLAQEQQT